MEKLVGPVLKQLVGLAWNSWVERYGVLGFWCDRGLKVLVIAVRVGVHFRA